MVESRLYQPREAISGGYLKSAYPGREQEMFQQLSEYQPIGRMAEPEEAARMTDGEVFDVIRNGVAPDFNMIPWKDKLKDPDVWNVVNYLRSIAKKK